MIKFFRKIRQNLISEGKTLKYLKYAIGEIILVVIGILIALSINNWNEENNRIHQKADIYRIIKTDLIKDTSYLEYTAKGYKGRVQMIQSRIDKNISDTYFDTITASNFEECRYCNHLANSYNHIFIRETGFELLKQFKVQTNDTLSIQLLNFYQSSKEFFEDDNKTLKRLGRENGKLLEKYDWYPYFKERKYHPEYIDYISENQEYINKLSTYKNFAELAIEDIQHFKNRATYFIKVLDTELNQ